MRGIYIDSTAIVEIEEDNIGEFTDIWHWVHIMKGAKIGKNCTIGGHVFIGSNVKIGDNVRIQNNVYIPEGVTIEDNVFIGPNVVFTNVKHPHPQMDILPEDYQKIHVYSGVVIGANATILPGIFLNPGCFIGAGAVVTKFVNAGSVVAGNPAKEIYDD